jgi:hypothetical protein
VSATTITVDQMLTLAKKLRLKAYYDFGDPDGDSDRASTVREARSSALIEVADAIDEVFEINSQLTPEDLGRTY